MYTNTD